ncbi:MAG: TPM domain-containing protein [Acidobacteriota bacterium]|nr:TPM domain-containing protein [Acidobacteriota bacterium]
MKQSCRLLAVAVCFAAAAFAVDWKALKPEGYVSDFAHVIDATDRAELEDYAARVQQATGAQLAFVTIPSLEGEPIEDVANDIFHAWGIGRKKEDDGAMVLLSVGDRKSRLEVGGGLGGIVPDGMAGLLLDDMRPALRQREYGSALLMAAQRLGSTIAASKNATIPAPAIRHRVQPEPHDTIPWPLIFFGIFILLMLLRRGGGGRFHGGGGGGGFWEGMLLGALMNSGRRSSFGGRDGGGFGGFDSGGSGGGFGGFGGGDSGGGGASSDW